VNQARKTYSPKHPKLFTRPGDVSFRHASALAKKTRKAVGQKGKGTCAYLDPLNFLKRDFIPMNLLCKRAKMLEDWIDKSPRPCSTA
jgi:hypothetical protein